MRRVGIFGGSFDPIHIGHLIVANDAMEQRELDRVLFIPAAAAPLKPHAPKASAEDRLAMVSRAIAGEPQFEALDYEIARGGTSYSIETAQEIERRYDDSELYWILGGDQVQQLHNWHRIEELAQTVEFIYFERGEPFKRPSHLPDSIAIHPLQPRRIDVSSSEIRDRLEKGSIAKYFLPDGVLDYIKARNLYRENRDES